MCMDMLHVHTEVEWILKFEEKIDLYLQGLMSEMYVLIFVLDSHGTAVFYLLSWVDVPLRKCRSLSWLHLDLMFWYEGVSLLFCRLFSS